MRIQRRLSGVVLAMALLTTAVACAADDDQPDTRPSARPTTGSPAATPSAPTETAEPSDASPKQRAKRLAAKQAIAYIAAYDQLYAEPDLPLSLLNDFARDPALAEIKQSIQTRRDRGERISGRTKVTKTWLGEEGVVFNKRSPQAVVDLFVCYDLGQPRITDANGDSKPLISADVPRIAQARYAVYSEDWPNEDPSQWRVGKEFAAGEPCTR